MDLDRTVDLDNLIITQHEMRNLDELPAMIRFVINGGIWMQDVLNQYAAKHNFKASPLIQLSRFPDSLIYVHDGHHRLVATWMGGRDILYDNEYIITDWTYEQYLEINLDVGWVTPFDLRIECRNPDISKFKNAIKEIAKTTPSHATELIEKAHIERSYCEPRKFNKVSDLARTLKFWSGKL